ncbi:Kelch-type beta propeller [Arabidopsis suecica]|uniref:Kelch-type beta propeller n=1 Tax=Arabidopsis suecica TaxID=45249 RepID=A0A8T2CCS2_ARASU|nr:Kelch-type beta propeller [Arabidopsis suecica]
MEEEKRRCRHISQEIVEDILVKLHVRSLMRFKAVSRDWRGTIESKFFLERHFRFQKPLGDQARILTISSETRYDRLAFDTMLFSTNGIVHEISPYPPISPIHQFEGSKISVPCDGLFCLYSNTQMSILNPATTCCRSLPYPTSTIYCDLRRDYTLLGIGRENSERRRYKIVCYFECDDKKVNESTKCKVFALDSNTWKDVDPPHCRVRYGHSLVHLDGVIYCFTCEIEPEHAKVLAFDLHTEKFQSFSISPYIGFKYSRNSGMHVLNRRLCIFDNDTLLQIWGLDINKGSWDMMHSIDVSKFSQSWRIIPMATINNYVIITNDEYHNLWALYDSKNHVLHHTCSLGHSKISFGMPYFETLVSAYQ